MNKQSLPRIAFFQASGVILYIVLFVLTAKSLGPDGSAPFPFPEVILPMIFLLAFVFSALVCALIVFGFPIKIGLEGRSAEAIKIVVMTAGWLFLAGVIVLVVLSSTFLK